MASLEALKTQICGILESSSASISDGELGLRMPSVPNAKRAQALNGLLKEGRIRVSALGGVISYELVRAEKTHEDLVLESIAGAGSRGIWIRKIRDATKLTQVALNKALKVLESRKTIRTFKSSQNQKSYILFELQPDESVTGGACFQGGSILEDVVQNLKSTCFQYFFDRYQIGYQKVIGSITANPNSDSNLNVANANSNNIKMEIEDSQTDNPQSAVIDQDDLDEDGDVDIYASAAKVYQHFQSVGNALFADIKLADVEHILNILVYECKLNMKDTGFRRREFRYNPYNRDKTDLFYSPCMVCHLYKDCKPGALRVSPETCDYLSVGKF